MTALATEPSALDVFVEELRQRDLRDLTRGVLRAAQQRQVSEAVASCFLMAHGIGITADQVQDAIEHLDTLDSPMAAAEREMPDGYLGSLDEAAYRLRDIAQHDLDDLIRVAVMTAAVVSTGVAGLAALNLLVAS